MSTIYCCRTLRLLSWSYLLVLLFVPLTAGAVNLTGLSLTPQNATLNISNRLPLIATGSYDDGTQLVNAQAKQVAAGGKHTCTLNSNGAIQCWGLNTSGELGNGTTIHSPTPVTVSGISTAVAVSAGGTHTCAKLTNGAVQCWGENYYGELGNGTTTNSPTPVTVSGISTAGAVSAGGLYTCATLTDGTVRCWGRNGFGQLGNGTTVSSSTPVTVSGISTAVSVSAGASHTCAALTDGTVRCWGNNYYGQLGNGTTIDSPTPVTVSGISTAVSVSAGYVYTCATLTDGTVRCWGSYDGQLGNGTIPSPTPVTVSGISTAVSVSAGAFHTCATLTDGTVWCWGGNGFGKLGNGATIGGKPFPASSALPLTVSGISAAVSVSAGTTHTCATLTDGTVRCWGENFFSQHSYGATTVAVSAYGYHTCAKLADGTVRCQGVNYFGQLGNGTTIGSSTLVTVSGISTAVAVSAGFNHTCAVLTDGTVRCWGDNRSGQLGNDTTAESSTPVTVSGISTAVAVSAGGVHTCAKLADGTVRCWGDNGFGQLGNGTFAVYSLTPVTVSGINTAVAVSAGGTHTCATLTDGTVQCWGWNSFGQLGNNATSNGTPIPASSASPITVYGISTAVAVGAGTLHTCALLADGTARCWGRNNVGQLGNGTNFDSPTPVPVFGIGAAVTVSAGDTHTCTTLTDGTVRCWGSNHIGPPFIIGGISTAVTVSTGRSHTCATLVDGTVRCGRDNGVPLDGTTTPASVLGYLPLTWNSSNPSVASVNGVGQVQALSAGSAIITANMYGVRASTTVTVAPATTTVTSFWPGSAVPGSMVFVFGSNFVPNATQVAVNGISHPIVQVLSDTLLAFFSTSTTGPITVTTGAGSATSSSNFGILPTGLQITGIWPGQAKAGSVVLVFGSGFDPVPGKTKVSINGLPCPMAHILNPTLLLFFVPAGAVSGPVTVGVSGQTVTSGTALTIVP